MTRKQGRNPYVFRKRNTQSKYFKNIGYRLFLYTLVCRQKLKLNLTLFDLLIISYHITYKVNVAWKTKVKLNLLVLRQSTLTRKVANSLECNYIYIPWIKKGNCVMKH